jgi:uncharacterized membrane protein (UPF0127 family)
MNIRFIRIIHSLVFLLNAPASYPDNLLKPGVISFTNDLTLHVEIADTQELREFGLMQRTKLENNAGMLFVYPDEDVRGVWMKNTLLALDVLFLSETGKVVSMLQNLQPCKQSPCSIYSSHQKAQFMLEVNAGFIARHTIKLGQDVMLDYQHTMP